MFYIGEMKLLKKWLIRIGVGVVALYIVGIIVVYFLNTQPTDLGWDTKEGFKPCPESPNCVSSYANSGDEEHYIDPIAYSGDAAAAWEKLLEVTDKMPRTHIVQQTDAYAHIEFTTMMMRFTDDVEFRLNTGKQYIDVRSASRLGKSDFGVNRKRVEAIRKKFSE